MNRSAPARLRSFFLLLAITGTGLLGCDPALSFARRPGAAVRASLPQPEDVKLVDAAPPRGWESIGTLRYKGTCDEVQWLGTDRNVAGWSKAATQRVREEGARQGCKLIVLGTIQRLCDDAVSKSRGSGVAYYAECWVGAGL